jgi:hypothetical protein
MDVRIEYNYKGWEERERGREGKKKDTILIRVLTIYN